MCRHYNFRRFFARAHERNHYFSRTIFFSVVRDGKSYGVQNYDGVRLLPSRQHRSAELATNDSGSRVGMLSWNSPT
jgi:hypothetical protein